MVPIYGWRKRYCCLCQLVQVSKRQRRGVLGLPVLCLCQDGPNLGWFLPVGCLHKTSHLRKEMADAGWRQSISQNIGRKKKKLTKLSFKCIFGEGERAKWTSSAWTDMISCGQGILIISGSFWLWVKYLDFSCSASPPGDRDLGGSWTLGTRLISFLLQSRESIYLIKFPLSLVFPLS